MKQRSLWNTGLEGKRQGGFTLIELLVVIAIMAIMIGISLPSLRGMLGGHRQQQNLLHMQQILEQAQVAAQTRNTYVWVGITNLDSAGAPLKVGGVAVTLVSVLYGLTGASGDLSGSPQVPTATTAFLMPPQVFRDAACPPLVAGNPVAASEINALKNANTPDVGTPTDIFYTSASDSGTPPTSLGLGFNQRWNGQQVAFTHIIQFNSTGQPMVYSTLSNWIELCLGPALGATVANSSGLLISGLTGKITLIP